MVVLDTSILIDYLRRPEDTNSHLVKLIDSRVESDLRISIISIQELYTGLSTRNIQQQKLLIAIISGLNILPYDYEVAQLAGEILRDIKPKMGFADAAIAATAILNKATLFTLNKKDFQDIKGLKLI